MGSDSKPISRGSKCDSCGTKLPWHLFDLGENLSFRCNCGRVYSDEKGVVRETGYSNSVREFLLGKK